MKSKLIVFEGPDNIGKTTLCNELGKNLSSIGHRIEVISFPGNRSGTLGKFIHEFHHRYNKYGIENLSNTSLQLLHVAAHFDTITEDILPALGKGKIVILDRFWWSTYVYGKVSGINNDVLEKIIELEELAWENLVPDQVFLLSNGRPFKEEVSPEWNGLRDEYLSLAEKQESKLKIKRIKNEGRIQKTVDEIIGILNFEFITR
ncbi:MAG: hypothetical protein WEA58_08585 [Balneolaceae bacterium]